MTLIWTKTKKQDQFTGKSQQINIWVFQAQVVLATTFKNQDDYNL